MNSSTLRQLWSVIEETQTSILLNFSDADLIHQLLKQFQNQKLLNNEELSTISAYLNSKVLLIRDIALARLA
jgi:muconolactone delta-isomerase